VELNEKIGLNILKNILQRLNLTLH